MAGSSLQKFTSGRTGAVMAVHRVASRVS